MWTEKMKNVGKKKYIVDIFKEGWDHGEYFRRKIETIETYAVSKAQAENNARYRFQGTVYSPEIYGDECDFYSYFFTYEAHIA